ncbi:MAG: DUF859 family phage minor structural protein [Oscillospiraceae bacterium]|nr:DUF859 family phage minor structural protein [Oscillospiraceae bacterium]
MGTSAEMSTSNTYVKYNVSITQNSQSISGNYSNVTVSVYFWRTNSGYTTYGTGTIYCKINGTTYSASVTTSQKITNSGITLFSKTLDISHNSDGSKTLTCSAWISIDAPLSSSEQSYSQGLTTIGRASSFSGGSGNIGSSTTITISRASSSFTHKLYYDLGSGWVTIASGVGTSYSWTIPTSFYARIPNSNSGSGTLWCETYNGSSYVGSNSISFNFYVTNSNPTFTSSQIAYQDTNSSVVTITGNNQQIVQNQSSLQISFTSATARNSASMSSYQITFNGSTTTRTSSGSISYGAVNSSSNLTLQIKAIDSRGNSATASKTIIFLAWQTPQISYSIARVNNFENTTNILANVSISSVNGKNSLQTLQYRTKQTSSSTWSSWSSLTNGTAVQASFDNGFAWNFQIQAQDKFAASTINYVLNKGMPIMFFDTNKISVGVNTLPANSNSFETTNIDIKGVSTFESSGYVDFNGNIYANAHLYLKSTAANDVLNLVYPVGAIYMSVSSTNPSSLFGGSWSLWGSGRVPVCVNTSDSDFNTVEETGGAKTVTLTTSQMPSHTHGLARAPAGSGYKESYGYTTTATREQTTYSDSAGSGSSHTNLQPYITCYMWKRTA